MLFWLVISVVCETLTPLCQVMIKNIPNKMSDRHLLEFINNICPRKIDFLYLRMCVPTYERWCKCSILTPHSGISRMGVMLDMVRVRVLCAVRCWLMWLRAAFVNFIHVEDLLHFAKTKLGTKWYVSASIRFIL